MRISDQLLQSYPSNLWYLFTKPIYQIHTNIKGLSIRWDIGRIPILAILIISLCFFHQSWCKRPLWIAFSKGIWWRMVGLYWPQTKRFTHQTIHQIADCQTHHMFLSHHSLYGTLSFALNYWFLKYSNFLVQVIGIIPT